MKEAKGAVVPGKEYLLDGRQLVKVIKQVGRSGRQFSVEHVGNSIEIVEKDRLEERRPDPDK